MVIVRRLFLRVIAWGVPGIVGLLACASYFSRWQVVTDINALTYDRFAARATDLSRTPANVLLVYTDASTESNPASFQQLVAELHDLGASAIGVIQLDISHWTGAELDQLVAQPSLVLGHLEGSPGSPSRRRIARRGNVQLLRSRDGVYRSHYGRRPAPSNATSQPDLPGKSLEAQLAAITQMDPRDIPEHEFLIHFRGGAESLPHVAASDILARDITASLVRDRVVLIGRRPNIVTPSIVTPTTRDGGMSVLELHGHAMNSILNRSTVATLPRWAFDGLLLGSTLMFVIVGRRLRLDRALLWIVGLAAAQIAAVFVVLVWASVWIPVLTLVMSQVAALLFSFNRRMQFSERAWQLMRRRGFSVSPRYRNQPFLSADAEPWHQILALYEHVFPLDGIALLLKTPNRRRLQLMTVWGHEEQLVKERRPSLDRQPYSDAIEQRSAMRLDESKPFFAHREGQVQFLCPLLQAGQLQGMIVVELSASALAKVPGFEVQLTELSDEVATWLAAFADLSQQAQERRRWWYRLGTNLESDTFHKLQMHLTSIERRLHQSYDVIERASSGKAVFDLSGNVVTMNATMFRLLHRYGLASTDCRLLQVLRAISTRDVLECRELVRDILMKGRRERMIVSDPKNDDAIVIVIQALVKTADTANDPQAMLAFKAQGVLVELFETSMLDDAAEVREHVAGAGLSAVDELLDDILVLTQEARRSTSPEVFQQLNQNVAAARQTVSSCQSMLSHGDTDDVNDRVPVHLETVIRASLAETQLFAEKRLATVSADLPRDLPPVDANPTRLRRALLFALESMISSARENSQINVAVRHNSEFVQIMIQNEGCGVAFDRLAGRRLSTGTEESLPSRLEDMRAWLTAWGGQLKTDASLGEGASITLELRRFSWARQLTLDTPPATSVPAIATND